MSKLWNAAKYAAIIAALVGAVGALYFGPTPQAPVQEPEFTAAVAVMLIGLVSYFVFGELAGRASRKESIDRRRARAWYRRDKKRRRETSFINPCDMR